MRSEVWRTWTTVNDQTVYLDLPTEDIIRRIVLQADPSVDAATFIADAPPHEVIQNLTHTLQTGLIEVYDGKFLDLAFWNYFGYGYEGIVAATPYFAADVGNDMGLGRYLGKAFTQGAYGGAESGANATFRAGETRNTVTLESADALGPDEFLAKGIEYHNTAVLRHDWNDDPFTWLDSNAEKQVLLDVHTYASAGAAGGTVRVLLDRLVRT